MNRALKSIAFLLSILSVVFQAVQAQEYVLDFSKTQTYRGFCAGIAADRLSVSKDSCEITTNALYVDASMEHQKAVLISVKINKEGKLGKAERAWVKLLVNGKVNKSYIIKGDAMLENYKRQDKIIIAEPGDISVQVTLKSTAVSRSWVIKNGDIEIAASNYTGAKELNAFNGNFTGRVVKLTWTTALETNNNYFTIERSKDGVTFEKAALVKGAGTSESIHQYAFVDHNLYSSNTYYRLKQISFSGKEKQVGEVINIPTSIAENPADTKRDNVSLNSIK